VGVSRKNSAIIMDIIVDIQGFSDISSNFLPKEVAIVTLHASFTGHWILLPRYSFEALPEKSRRENNWLTQNYHGIEWFDGETDEEYFTTQLREITRLVRNIYTRGKEKADFLQRMLSRSVYNLEGISPPFKNLPEDEKAGRQRCIHHGFRYSPTIKYHCALRNAFKLKRWLLEQDIDSGYEELSHENPATNRPNAEEIKEETTADDDDGETCGEEATAYYTFSVPQPAFVSRSMPTLTHMDNSASSPRKEVSPTVEQLIPTRRTPPRDVKNEYAGNLASAASTPCRTCGSLSCRQSTEGVDETDCDYRQH